MNFPSPPEAPLSRREEAKALFRNAILEAAERVFAERGFHVARIQDVAKHARIAVGTVYNHFEQKEDLLHALLEERTAQMIALLSPSPSDPVDFEARLVARLTRVLGYVEQHRSFFLVAMEYGVLGKGAVGGEAVCGKRMHQVEKFRAAFKGLMEEGLAAGALDPMPVHRLAWSLAGMVRLFTYGALVEGIEPDLKALAPIIAGLFLHGAARKAPAEATRAMPHKPSPKTDAGAGATKAARPRKSTPTQSHRPSKKLAAGVRRPTR